MDDRRGVAPPVDGSLLLAAIADETCDAILALDSEGTVIFANAAAAEFAGLTAGLKGRHLEDLFPAGGAAALREGVARARATGEAILAEDVVHRQHGPAHVVSARYAPLRDAQGRIVAVVARLRDITGERNQQDNATRYFQMAEITEEAWWEGDLLTGGTKSSRRLCEMLGWDESMLEPALAVYWEHVHPEDRQQAIAAFEASLRTGADFSTTYRARHADGHYIWIEDKGRIVARDSTGRPARMMGVMIDVTARKEAEIALSESERRYRMVADITREAWSEEDLVAGITTSNQRFCEMLGLGEEMLSCSLDAYRALVHPDDRERAITDFEQSVGTDDEFQAVYRLRHADGHYIWVEDRGRVMERDGSGRATRTLGAVTDITARREAEIALQKSEERYRQVAEITREAWWDEDVPSQQLTNSPRFSHILGRGAEVLNCSVEYYRSLIHPDDRAHTRAAYERAVEKNDDYRETYRLRHAEGHYLWVEDRARVVERDAGGRAVRMLGAITDVTARKRAELALRTSEENFRLLFDDAPDAYVISGTDALIVACNNAAERMLRGTSDRIIGTSPLNLSPPLQPDGRSSQEAGAEMIRIVLEKGYHRFEWVHRRFDGSDFWTEVTLTVGRFRGQTVIYAIWREIGEIIAAKQAAEAASFAKSQFLSVMSHELRTPLTAIMGMFQLIEIAGCSDKARDFVARGLRSSEHLLKMVEDILDFSNIEAGRLALVARPFRLGTLLEEVSDAAGTKRKPQVGFAIDADAAMLDLRLSGDAQRLKQVLVNLLGNAFKFTDQGKVTVAVRKVDGLSEAPLLEYVVQDTGIGLSMEEQGQLFDAFSQADMSDTRRFGGTGLGLAISQRLVKLLGGEPIVVESRPGVGSRFAFRLKLPLAETVEQIQPGRRLAGQHILLVEASETVRLTLRILLQTEGASVEEATDGAEGVAKALAASPPHDSVLMDVQLPVLDGLAATRELRRQGYGRPILGLTTGAAAAEFETFYAAGMTGFIAKPVKIQDLVAALLEAREQAAAGPRP